ncbi:MAG: FAD-dependent oxidoreductase [Thermodesulfobacteriota bacterium]
MKFVVIGGDAAGMSAASRAKRHVPDMDVMVLEKTNDVSYSACGMPYNIADPARNMDDLVVRSAEVFRNELSIDLRLGHTVEQIDRLAKKVRGTTSEGAAFEVEYDKLLIATGASPSVLDVPGNDLDGVVTLKSLEDGRVLKDYIQRLQVQRVMIVGIGYIGMEMAEAYRALGIRVDMTKPGQRLLPWMPEEIAKVIQQELLNQGVMLHLGAALEKIERSDGGLKLIFSNHEAVEVQMVLMGVGIKPNSGLAADAGLELGPANSIAVDKRLRTSDPDIYAAGDCADAFNVITGRRVWVPLALRANRAGWAVADNLRGEAPELPGIVGTAVFKVFGLEIARTGLSVKEARDEGFDPVEEVITSSTRAHRHPGSGTIHVALVGDRKTGRLLGGVMVGTEGAAHRINAVAVALHAGMTVAEFCQCDLAYAPPFSPVWDPALTAGNQLLKAMG